MPTEITIPRLGWSMEEGTLTEWLKSDGQWVERGEMLFVLEGDKAAQEIESFESGVLRIPPDGPRPGDTVKVGQVIGFLVEQGAAAPFERPAAERQAVESEPMDPPAIASPPPAAGPAARRVARELGVDLAHATGTGRGGRILAADVRHLVAGPRASGHPSHPGPRDALPAEANSASVSAGHYLAEKTSPSESPRRSVASPRARRIARELGIDWTLLHGTGRGGRVRERDVRAAAEQAPPATASSRRRTIADRMVASLRATAPVTLTSRASAANLLNLRAQFKVAAAGCEASLPEAAAPSLTELLVKLAAAALARHPEINSRWEGEQSVRLSDIHIGVAVDDDSGLVVPVVHDVPKLGVRQIAARLRELVEKARSRRLTADEMSGGTFTITNLGMFGIDAFTPILNPPQTAILGVGAIRREPVILADDRIVPGNLMTLSLTFDHRVIDGAPAARFLRTLVETIENPAAWLVT